MSERCFCGDNSTTGGHVHYEVVQGGPMTTDCDKCEGDGMDMAWPDDPGSEPIPCPSCGGTGYQRMIPLDGIDVEAMRVTVESPSTPDVGPHGKPIQPYPVMRGKMIEGCRTTLRDGEYVLVPFAAIDQEETRT